MENQARRNFKVFPTPEELIEANNKYEQSCYLKITKKDINNCDSSASFDSTLLMESSISSASCSSSSSEEEDLMEDATSPSTTITSSSSSSNGPLYQLSDLMDKLPIKRGLSKYYEGKSESFTSLADVGNLEDLVKRQNPYKKKFKLCRNNNYFSGPKSSISKKSCYSRTPFSSSLLVARTCSNNFKSSCTPPTIPPVQKEF